MLGMFPWFFKYRAHKCITEDTCFLLHSNFQLQYGAHKCITEDTRFLLHSNLQLQYCAHKRITEDTRFLLHSNLQLLQVTSSPSLDLDQSCQAGEQAKLNSWWVDFFYTVLMLISGLTSFLPDPLKFQW